MKKASLGSIHGSMTSHKGMASASSKMGGKGEAPPAMEGGEGGEHSELHDHGDGSFHTVVGGQQTEHPHLHHALIHMAAHHGAGEKHMAVHHMPGGSTVTTHHAGSDGAVQGPHEHDANNLEGLKQHMDKFLSEEAMEGGGGQHEEEPAMSGSSGEMY
jgi:hypothetical protein